MMGAIGSSMKLDKNTIIQAARSAAPLTIKTYTLPHDTEEELEGILEVFLKEMGQEKLKDPLFYCLRANTYKHPIADRR